MTIEVTTAHDEVVSVRLVRGNPVADIDALRKYHREYYHANRQEMECEHCKSKFSSQCALVRHQRRSQKCSLIRAKAELEMLRTGQAAAKLFQTVVHMTPSIFEPIGAGITVAIFNEYILNRFDPFAYCYTQCCNTEGENEDCVSSSSTSGVSGACHLHHFFKLYKP